MSTHDSPVHPNTSANVSTATSAPTPGNADTAAPTGPAHLRFQVAGHLAALLADVDRLTSLLGDHATDLSFAAIRATLGLDGADTELMPDLASAAATAADGHDAEVSSTTASRSGTWLDTLRALDDPSDPQIRALEVLGVQAALDSADLATSMQSNLTEHLAELHRRLTRGLVAADRAGKPRQLEQAVHDGSTGRILYFTTEPDDVPDELAALSDWAASSDEHAVVTSGVLHHELLRIHPFDAANGRLARTVARLVLQSAGIVADFEPVLATDPLGYHEEVARSIHRRDLTIWLERWAESVVSGLRDAARFAGLLDVEVADADRAFLDANPTFTVADVRAHADTDADRMLVRLLDAGVIAHTPGTRGLRFTT